MSIYHTKQLNAWPSSSASHVVNHNQLSACQEEMEPFEEHLCPRECPSSLRNKPQQTQHGQLSIPIPGWIVRKCVQALFDGKNVSYCCARGSWLFSDSTTYVVGGLVLALQLHWTSVKCGKLTSLWQS